MELITEDSSTDIKIAGKFDGGLIRSFLADAYEFSSGFQDILPRNKGCKKPLHTISKIVPSSY